MNKKPTTTKQLLALLNDEQKDIFISAFNRFGMAGEDYSTDNADKIDFGHGIRCIYAALQQPNSRTTEDQVNIYKQIIEIALGKEYLPTEEEDIDQETAEIEAIELELIR